MGVEVRELGELALEVQPHGADGAVTLLGDDAFADIVDLGQPLLPALIAIVELFLGLFGPASGLLSL